MDPDVGETGGLTVAAHPLGNRVWSRWPAIWEDENELWDGPSGAETFPVGVTGPSQLLEASDGGVGEMQGSVGVGGLGGRSLGLPSKTGPAGRKAMDAPRTNDLEPRGTVPGDDVTGQRDDLSGYWVEVGNRGI